MELGGGGGESATKRSRLSDDFGAGAAGAGEDRLSALPNDDLVLILLRLPTSAAARTSVLSRSWRRIWALLPALHFHGAPEPHRLRDALDAHEVPVRDLRVGADGATTESLAIWLPAAARRVSGNLTLLDFCPVKVAEEEDDDEVAAVQRGSFEFPCFEKATSIWLLLGFQGLAVPPTGVFTRLTRLHLSRVWFHGSGDLGDAVSSPRCPCLQTLTVDNARGLGHLSIHSESLLEMVLKYLSGLSQLTVVAPALKKLTVALCFLNRQPVANISAPQLEKLDWADKYDPSSVHLGKMEHVQWLGTGFYMVYYVHNGVTYNHSCLSLLQRFEDIKTLSLSLMYLRDIENCQYMMEDMPVLPDITLLCLLVIANGHAFGASAFHVLRLCNGIRRLILQFRTSHSKAQTVCSPDCICDQPADWETEELLLNRLEEVEIHGLRGSEYDFAFVKRLFNWGAKLKEMTVTFCHSTSEIKAKELYQILQSFSRPELCLKFYLYRNFSKVLYAPDD